MTAAHGADPLDDDIALPTTGQTIQYRKKGDTEWRRGVVSLIWWALDVEAVDVLYETEPYHVVKATVFPRLGDEWNAGPRRIVL